MDYRKQFSELIEFLSSYESMWRREVVFSYPEHLKPFPKEWTDELKEKSDQELWSIDSGETEYLKNPDFIKLINCIKGIQTIPAKYQVESEQRYPSWAFFRVKDKKKHEIENIVNLIKNNNFLSSAKRIIDIGGGQGHLGRILSYYHGHNVHVIDQNQEFLDLGIKRAKKYPAPEGAGVLTFEKHLFDENSYHDSNEITDTLTLGLHTCGPLAHRHFEQLIHSSGKALVNFGCCYNRLNPKTDTPISEYAKKFLEKRGLSLSSHSLTLATRGHKEKSLKAFLLKKRVKEYRCALHIYLYQNYSKHEFIPVGSEHPRVYEGSFANYAHKKLEALNINVNKEELSDYFQSEETQLNIAEMFRANIIRWQFGRALEKWILLDRAIYLEENGLNTEMFTLFDPELSPRNVGLLAYKK